MTKTNGVPIATAAANSKANMTIGFLNDSRRANPRTRHPALLVRDDGSEDVVTITEWTDRGFRLAVTLAQAKTG